MSASGWKLIAHASRQQVEAALAAFEASELSEGDMVASGHEIAEDQPDEWVFEAWMPERPSSKIRSAVASLFEGGTMLAQEELPDTDWVTMSQQAVEPIRAGRFHVRTPDHPPSDDAGTVDFVIPASQAFGTGQHETTAGCLAMLDGMKRRGVVARSIADIGTGTGLLAFGAMALWPRALATASDIDPVCFEVVEYNARENGVPLGEAPGELAMVVADGLDDPLLQARATYDLLIANILAGPLIDLAPDFARVVPPGGHVVLAGLLETQEAAVRHAFRRAGFRFAARIVNGDWSILWLRRR